MTKPSPKSSKKQKPPASGTSVGMTQASVLKSSNPFGDHAERALDHGYRPIPVEGKKPKIKGWNHPLDEHTIRKLTRNPKMAEANMGFLTGTLVAIDIDHDDAALADKAAMMTVAVLGETPFVRFGRHPRRVLFYRCDAEIDSHKVGAVEILGKGKFVVVAGLHPATQQPYGWPEESLLDHDFSDVPLIDAKKLDQLLQHLRIENHDTQQKAADISKLQRDKIRHRAENQALRLASDMRARNRGGLNSPVLEGERNVRRGA